MELVDTGSSFSSVPSVLVDFGLFSATRGEPHDAENVAKLCTPADGRSR